MARPRKPLPDGFVERVRSLYDGGMTQGEIAVKLGVTQQMVWITMRRNGIPARPAVVRDQRGPKNRQWKGDAASYSAAHTRVAKVRGKPSRCEECGTTDPAKQYEWASISRNYTDVNDYRRLCGSCHKRADGIITNFPQYRGVERSGAA